MDFVIYDWGHDGLSLICNSFYTTKWNLHKIFITYYHCAPLLHFLIKINFEVKRCILSNEGMGSNLVSIDTVFLV